MKNFIKKFQILKEEISQKQPFKSLFKRRRSLILKFELETHFSGEAIMMPSKRIMRRCIVKKKQRVLELQLKAF